MLAAPLPPRLSASTASLSIDSLPGLHATFTSEHAILEQLLYKNKNQHRKANYYQKLMAVARSNRHVNLTHSSLSSLRTLLSTADSLRSSLVAILQAAEPLYALLRQTYFMPFALTSLAVLARLLAVSKAALVVVLVEAKDREEREQERVRLFAARSVATALLRALREKRVEGVATSMAGHELDEPWAGDVDGVVSATEREENTPHVHPKRLPHTTHDVAVVDDDDDSHSALQSSSITAAAAVTSLRHAQPPTSTSTSTSTSARSSTLPAVTAPHSKSQSTIPSGLPISHSSAVSIKQSSATIASNATVNKKRKAVTPSTNKPTSSTPPAQPLLQERTRKPIGPQRAALAGGVKAVRVGTVGKGQPDAAVDDIDAIFGF